jgi:D-sedoheptulose 7-phosphate isomerase
VGFLGETYASASARTLTLMQWDQVEALVEILTQIRSQDGRVFVVGLGGSAGNAGHMVNDLRKLTGIEAYAPTDNISELTARINDDGWGKAFVGWLKASRLSSKDAVFVLSVGGGDLARGVSTELVAAVDYAKSVSAAVLGIVGRDGGHTADVGDHIVVIPTVDTSLVTPIAEAFQALVWHGIVSHPELATASAHWESIDQA